MAATVNPSEGCPFVADGDDVRMGTAVEADGFMVVPWTVIKRLDRFRLFNCCHPWHIALFYVCMSI